LKGKSEKNNFFCKIPQKPKFFPNSYHFQSLIPLLTTILPRVIGSIIAYVKYTAEHETDVTSMSSPWLSIFNLLATIVFIHPYRNFCLQLLPCSKQAKLNGNKVFVASQDSVIRQSQVHLQDGIIWSSHMNSQDIAFWQSKMQLQNNAARRQSQRFLQCSDIRRLPQMPVNLHF
jgi:hypothetical protein